MADSQALTAAGMVHLLGNRDEFEIVANVNHRDELIDLVHKHRPQLLVADYNLPGFITIEDLQDVTKVQTAPNILVVSADDSKNSILEVLQLGVKGYVTKDCSREEVMMAVQSVSKGEKFFCHKILDIIMEKHFSPEAPAADPSVLTSRETEILSLLATGHSTQQIADTLHLSPHTVHTHRKSIIRKLNIKSPTEFVIYAMDFGLIKPK
nr:response regulator transcription factor [Chryseolinea lacunae]